MADPTDIIAETIEMAFSMKREAVRKLLHMLTVFIILLDFFFSKEFIIIFGALFIIVYVVAEYFRFKGERIAFITDLVKYAARGKELKGWVLTPLYILISIIILISIGGTVIPSSAAYVGIVAATFGDSSAALFGKKFGRHSHWILKGKSVEGSLAFFVTTFVGSLFFVYWPVAMVVAALAAIIEIFSGQFDNITIPFGAAFIAAILMAIK
jgi:phytol kinase